MLIEARDRQIIEGNINQAVSIHATCPCGWRTDIVDFPGGELMIDSEARQHLSSCLRGLIVISLSPIPSAKLWKQLHEARTHSS